MSAALLEIADLSVRFRTPEGPLVAVDGVSLSLQRGEVLGIVGESGSGKSQMLNAIMGLLPANAASAGSVRLDDQELLGLPASGLDALRGTKLSLIFQDPMTALNPYLTIERQLTEVLCHHRGLQRAEARGAALAALRRVHIVGPERQLDRYPHQLSGGMRQRVVIAMALIAGPALLLADEPTTALDVTVQAEILDLLAELRDAGLGVVLVTHDLGVIARLADRVLVMYAGRIVEAASAEALFRQPQHPYTRALLASVPRLDDDLADGGRAPITGQPPDLLHLPPGCAFAPRCPLAAPVCKTVPLLHPSASGGQVACHLAP